MGCFHFYFRENTNDQMHVTVERKKAFDILNRPLIFFSTAGYARPRMYNSTEQYQRSHYDSGAAGRAGLNKVFLPGLVEFTRARCGAKKA